ncbi:hypothetical protein HY345_01640 [Candidatus Microgenomates bacterium]|nr:hypothetical protein [Candidatus Microgenomates bacterium]
MAKNIGITTYLKELGFDEDAGKVYAVLTENGPLTPLRISRLAQIERTKLYRLIDEWKNRGLIEEQLAYKTRLLKACDLERIKLFLDEQKLKIITLENTFAQFSQTITSFKKNIPATKVLYYQGREGLRQMSWNILQSKTKLLSYTYRSFQEALGQQFFNNWAKEFITKKISFWELRHPDFIKSIDDKHLKYKSLGSGYKWKIAPLSVKITHSMDIYDDVVAVSYWKNQEMLGLEIHNRQIADMQRSIFTTLWKTT